MDAVHPGSFNMNRIKWEARFDYEFMENYKLLTEIFKKNGITKHIDVNKLVKAKPLDNLEFI
jgi:RP/EB family microtubule-associated protein